MTTTYNRPDGKNRFQIRSAARLTLPSAWLDQEFNWIYNALNSITISDTVSASEWTAISGTYTQESVSSFSVSGNLTSVFTPWRAIQFTDENEVLYNSHIQSSSYSDSTDITTVFVYNPIVPATISKVAVGLISEDSATIPSSHVVIKTNNYTIGALDKIVLVNDSMSYTSTIVYDDGQVGGDGYPALLITLPEPSTLSGKLVCVKKFSGEYKTIVSSAFTHSAALNDDNELVHTNTYDFQILGDSVAKNRVELNGIGDCYWFISDGNNWYELTPEASETVKGIVKIANESEMTLTAQQIADGETLRKDLAVSPYHLDIDYLRTDASNMRFSSNYIYQSPNGVAALINNNIVVYKGLGLNVPDGRDENGVIVTKKHELNQNLTFAPVEVTDKLKLLFVGTDNTLQPILGANYYIGNQVPTVTDTQVGDVVIWFDLSSNLLKESTDNGTNWTIYDGCGPICEFYGNGTNITHITPYSAVGFLTRENLGYIARNAIKQQELDWSAQISYAKDSEAPADGIAFAGVGQGDADHYVYVTPKDGATITIYCGYSNDGPMFIFMYLNKGDKLSWNTNNRGSVFVPFKGYAGS